MHFRSWPKALFCKLRSEWRSEHREFGLGFTEKKSLVRVFSSPRGEQMNFRILWQLGNLGGACVQRLPGQDRNPCLVSRSARRTRLALVTLVELDNVNERDADRIRRHVTVRVRAQRLIKSRS